MKPMFKLLAAFVLVWMPALPAMGVDLPSEVTLFKNVNIFDGNSDKLVEGQDVLVVNNLIKKVAKDIPTEGTYELEVKTGGLTRQTVSVDCLHTYTILVPGEGGKVDKKEVKANVIDGGGRTLVPGMTDAHWHALYAGLLSLDQLRTEELDYIYTVANQEAGNTLMRGFTTVRDVGGA